MENIDNIKNIDNANNTDNMDSTESNNSSTSKEEKRIDVYKLVETYNKRASTKLKEEFLKSQIKIKPYMNYVVKNYLADQIIEKCCMDKNSVKIDSCRRYILYVYTMLKYWTNLDIKETELLVQYDLLDQHDMIEKILNLIPEKEVVTFNTLLDLKQNDFMVNNYGISAILNNTLNKIYPDISKALTSMLESMNDKINILDQEKFENMFNDMKSYLLKENG